MLSNLVKYLKYVNFSYIINYLLFFHFNVSYNLSLFDIIFLFISDENQEKK